MHATQDSTLPNRLPVDNPEPIGSILTRWLSVADACENCPNVEPPHTVEALDVPPGHIAATYECSDCGITWTRLYALKEVC